MADKEEDLLKMLQTLAEGCERYPEAQHWARWFKKDRDEFHLARQSQDRVRERAVLDDLRRALWGGMGAFCDGSAPTPELEKLGNQVYRLIIEIERKVG